MKIEEIISESEDKFEAIPNRLKYSWSITNPTPNKGELILQQDIDLEKEVEEEFFLEVDLEERSADYYLGLSKLSKLNIIEIEKDETKVIDMNLSEDESSCTLVRAKANTHSTLIISKTGNAKVNFEYLKIIAEKDSSVEVILFQNMDKESENYQYYLAKAKDNAKVNFSCMHAGSKFSKGYIINSLEGKGAKGDINLFYFGKESQKYDFYTSSVHKGEETESNIISKGAVSGKANALSRGLVRIEKNAKDSKGFETQEAIILSKDAVAKAIPNLEICNQDVACSHGSSISQIDEEQLMYLMSRGFDRESAENMLVEGFFFPVIDEIKEEKTRELFKEEIIKIIEGKNEN